MNHVWFLDTNRFETTVWYENFFDKQFCYSVEKLVNDFPLHVGSVSTGTFDNGIYNDIKKCQVSFIDPNSKTDWLYRKLTDVIKEVNRDYFNFEILHIEPVQLNVYNEGNYFVKHIDTVWNDVGKYPRKLSFVIQLSEPDEYEGGELLLYSNQTPLVANKSKGSIIFFPSFLLHEVTKITKGCRKSLVGWVRGPMWR